MSGNFKDKKDKRYAMYKHSLRRLKEHYKIDANEELYHKLCKYIRFSGWKGRVFEDGVVTKFIDKQSNTRSVWRIYWNNLCLIAAYDKTRKMIATFLPSNLEDCDIEYKRWLNQEDDLES